MCEKCTESHLVKTGSRHDALVLCLIENQFGTSVGQRFDDTIIL